MKILYITIIALMASVYAFGAQKQKLVQQESAPVAETVPAPVDYKDAFLGLVLEKATKYSSAVESGIGKAVETAQSVVSKAVDVASEEAPKLMQEFLVWRFIENLTWFVAPLFFFFVFATICYKYFPDWLDTFHINTSYSRVTTKEDVVQFKYGIISVFSLLFCVVTFVMTISNIDSLMSAVKIKVAPRVYIIEQAIELYKTPKTNNQSRK